MEILEILVDSPGRLPSEDVIKTVDIGCLGFWKMSGLLCFSSYNEACEALDTVDRSVPRNENPASRLNST